MSSKKLVFLLLILLLLLAIRYFTYFKKSFVYKEGEFLAFETRLTEEPRRTLRGQRVWINLPNGQRALTVLRTLPEVRYGDIIQVRGNVEYLTFDSGDSIALLINPAFEPAKDEGRLALIYKVRERIISFFNSHYSPTHSALFLGMVFGIKEEMPKEFSEYLRDLGLLHIIVASGMNVTLLGGFMLSLFGLFLRRQIALFASIIGIVLYCFMAGFDPAIVRASIMGILVFTAQIFGRQSMAFLGLLIAGFFMLFASPNLILDIGFQLSFMATLGLIFISPVFYISERMKNLIQRSVIGEDLVTTISAQLATVPIILSNFGTYSVISVLANGLSLWTVPFIMIIGGISGVISLIFTGVAALTSYFALPFLYFFVAVVDYLGSFQTNLRFENFPLSLTIGYYLLLLAIVLFSRHIRK